MPKPLNARALAPLDADQAVSLSEQAYQNIKWGLILGDFRPGDAISIRKTADRMGCSMMPVREALKRLHSERALGSSANRSFRVQVRASKNIAELFFLRAQLEGIATQLAAPRLEAAQIARLEELAKAMDLDIDRGDTRSYLSSNYSFHFTIYTAAGNAELVSLIEGLWAQTGPFLATGVGSDTMPRDWREMHGRIAAALAAGQADVAKHLIESDISWGVKLYSSEDPASAEVAALPAEGYL
jgi:DNA-binding GntR family transcriptional regulator